MTRLAPSTSVRRSNRRTPTLSLPVVGTALLLIDVINDLAFPGSEVLVAQAEPMALRLRVLKRRAAAAGVPVIYVNDNFGQWRSDFRQTVAHCTARTSPGRLVSQRLRPTARDYFVLKPKHSGFFDTTLDTLLDSLGTRDSDGHCRQHLRPVYGQRRAHARPEGVRTRRLHRVEHLR
jgi:hypothetical protein